MDDKKRSPKVPLRQFRVFALSQDYPHVDVLAQSKDDAMEIAERIDGGYFTAEGLGDWSISHAVEVHDDQPFEPLDDRCYDTL